jgi:hypothetical protein
VHEVKTINDCDMAASRDCNETRIRFHAHPKLTRMVQIWGRTTGGNLLAHDTTSMCQPGEREGESQSVIAFNPENSSQSNRYNEVCNYCRGRRSTRYQVSQHMQPKHCTNSKRTNSPSGIVKSKTSHALTISVIIWDQRRYNTSSGHVLGRGRPGIDCGTCGADSVYD